MLGVSNSQQSQLSQEQQKKMGKTMQQSCVIVERILFGGKLSALYFMFIMT